ncbi:MAG: BON domain-containing protein [Massilia sp.]
MKSLIATLLATAAGASFAAAPTAALNHDPATYRNVTQKAAADYKTATAKCTSMSGNDKDVCMADAKATRAHAEADALAQYNNSAAGREKSRTKVAEADYSLAKAKCGAKGGADKDDCLNNAKSVHTSALADAKAGRDSTVAATGSSGTSGTGMVSGTDSPAGASAADKCAQAGGGSKTGCLIEQRAPVTAATGATTATGAEMANRTKDAASTAADKTKAAAATAAQKTKELARTAVEKTKDAASTVAQKTENAMDRAGDKSRQAASTAGQKTENAMDKAGEKTRDTASTVADKTERATDNAGHKTAAAASDTAITTKVKANIFKEPDLKSMAIHVDTEKGVVMLSGFVDSKAEADKAVKVAKSVDGVTSVKSAIKVK